MRIISGHHKGRKIIPPKNLNARPTTDIAKESLFNILHNHYKMNKISTLDLFSGTGNISYEFGSRGCNNIISIDNNYTATSFIKTTSNILSLNIRTIKIDALKYLDSTKETFDIIFADPPYKYEKHQEIVDLINKRKILNKEGMLIIEHDKTTDLQGQDIEKRKYGTVHFSIFKF